MNARRTPAAALVLAASVLVPLASSAQQPAPAWPDPPGARPPAAPAQPAGAGQRQGGAPARAPQTGQQPGAEQKAKKPATKPKAKSEANATVVRCGGVFAKDTSHAKLVETFGAANVASEAVDGAEGAKLNATVIYPKNPRRRLEVIWQDEAGRQRPTSVVIGRQSTWRLERGLRLGMGLADVEKANGKPFKLTGFDWDYGGTVSDWQGGAFANITGGCRYGVRFRPDDKAPQAARGKVSGDAEFVSTDPNMRAMKAKVFELFVSYAE